MTISGVAVVILNYNNKDSLQKFLPDVVRFSAPHQVYVADNGSTDDSPAYVSSQFPQVKIIHNNGNYGYADGCNRALSTVGSEICVLLNSDVEVTENWLSPILKLFNDDSLIAAVQPRLLDYKNRDTFEYAGASGGFVDRLGYPFCRGRVFNSIEKDLGQYSLPAEIFWATGACLAVRMEPFRRAGGFDPRYFAHMEEIDLCWRLKNFGYKIFAQPASTVYHVGGGTLNKISPRKTYLNFRNNLSTLLKNHPAKGLAGKILLRLLLDGVAGAKFLLEGSPLHCIAVVRAHFAFYGWIPSLIRDRRKMQAAPGFSFSTKLIYSKNIVYEYFIRGRKKFSDLDADAFS